VYISETSYDTYEPAVLLVVADPDGVPHNNKRVEIRPNEGFINTSVGDYRPEEIVRLHMNAKLNNFGFEIYYSTRQQLVLDSILSLVKTIVICGLLAGNVVYLTRDAKVLLLNPIERIATKVGKIALNP
jgi:hypothetical protein